MPHELIMCIVNFGNGTKVLREAEKCGVKGGTIFLGHGTVRNRFLEFLDICDVRKEIVIMLTDHEVSQRTLQRLKHEMSFDKPNHGIALTMPLEDYIGSSDTGNIPDGQKIQPENKKMYKAIFTIVDKGFGEDVVEVAKKCGSRGATLINARGSAAKEALMLFNMEIEPEKEIVLIIAESEIKEKIIGAISREMKIEEPGKGIVFVLGINEVCGLC